MGFVIFVLVALVLLMVIAAISSNDADQKREQRRKEARERRQKELEEKKQIYEIKKSEQCSRLGEADKVIALEEYNIDKEIAIFGQAEKIIIIGNEMSFSDILDYTADDDYKVIKGKTEYTSQTKSKNGSTVGRAIVGGVLAGGAGAIIGGTTAKKSLARFEKQVLKHEPDLVIVAFGLNDVNYPLEEYLDALGQIFAGCRTAGSDVIFLTPNMLNTYVAEDTPPRYLEYAAETAEYQNSGRMDKYIYAAADLAHSMNVPVCDCYSKWKELSKTEDTTMLLINRINHPCQEMHKLFADALYDMIVGEGVGGSGDSTMVEKA